MYHNTNNETGETLKGSKKKANRQQDEVLAIYERQPDTALTAEEVHKIGEFKCPLTSIRRAITDLTNEGHLNKTSIQKMGQYGKYIYAYKLITVQPVRF